MEPDLKFTPGKRWGRAILREQAYMQKITVHMKSTEDHLFHAITLLNKVTIAASAKGGCDAGLTTMFE